MKPITVTATIAAEPDRVYETIVDIEHLPETSPDTLSVAFLGEQRSGPGTRFRETRQMGKKTAEFELELAECDASARTARFVSRHQDTVWDTRMQVVERDSGSHVSFTMDAITDSKMKSFVFGLMSGMFRKGMTKQVLALKEHCESASRHT